MRRPLYRGILGLASAGLFVACSDVPTEGPAARGPSLLKILDDGGMEAGGVASITSDFALGTVADNGSAGDWVPISWHYDLSGIDQGSGCEEAGTCQLGGIAFSITPELAATATPDARPIQKFAFLTTADFAYQVGDPNLDPPISVTEYRSQIVTDGQYVNNGSGQAVPVEGYDDGFVIPAGQEADLVFDYAFMTGQDGVGDQFNSFAVVQLQLEGNLIGEFRITRDDIQSRGLNAGSCGNHQITHGRTGNVLDMTVSYPLCTGWRHQTIHVAKDPTRAPSSPRKAIVTVYVSEAEDGNGGYHNNEKATTFALDNMRFAIDDGAENLNPVIDEIAIADVIRAGTPFTALASFTDGNSDDRHQASFNFRSAYVNATLPAAVTEDNGAGFGSVDYAFPRGGYYDVRATVTDDRGASTTAGRWSIIAYDPAAGSLVADGRILTPTGSYSNDRSREGEASFRIDVGYATSDASKPSGEVELHMPNGDLFRATSYEFLVVEGANIYVKGRGELIGEPGYWFSAQVLDGDQFGVPDQLLFRIWTDGSMPIPWVYMYDNTGPLSTGGNSRQVLPGGSVQIVP